MPFDGPFVGADFSLGARLLAAWVWEGNGWKSAAGQRMSAIGEQLQHLVGHAHQRYCEGGQ